MDDDLFDILKHRSVRTYDVRCNNIFYSLKKKGILFICNINEISKHFLGSFLNIKSFTMDFDELKKSYFTYCYKNKQYFDTKLNTNIFENEFHRYICKKYLGLFSNPNTILVKTFIEAKENLKEIDYILDLINAEIKRISDKSNKKDVTEKKTILEYYKTKYEYSSDEIMHFIKNKICNYSLSLALKKTPYIKPSPYFYIPAIKLYNTLDSDKLIKIFTELPVEDRLLNKFINIPAYSFEDICKIYENDIDEYNKIVELYIKQEDFPNKIKAMTKQNYLFFQRQDLVDAVLKAYKNKEYCVFLNLTPILIEGILHDLCILIRIPERKVFFNAFEQKLKALNAFFDYELCYEYYSFDFRLLRNGIIHGSLKSKELNKKEVANRFLLDLNHISNLYFNKKILLNQKIHTINQIMEVHDNINYKYILKYINLYDIKLPEFYNKNKDIEKINSILESKAFWSFIESEIKKFKDNKYGIITLLRKITKTESKIINKNAKEFLKKYTIKENKVKANDYLRRLDFIY